MLKGKITSWFDLDTVILHLDSLSLSVGFNFKGIWSVSCNHANVLREANKLSITKCEHWAHLWLADKSQTNLWAFLSAVPWLQPFQHSWKLVWSDMQLATYNMQVGFWFVDLAKRSYHIRQLLAVFSSDPLPT